MNEQGLIDAILDDDRPKVKKLLREDSGLAAHAVQEARLFETGIVHWIYAGDTALHLAAAGHRIEIIQLLLTAGSDPNSKKNHRRSAPLHYAADGCLDNPSWNAERQVEAIRSLLQAGAEINAQDKNGATPLHRAVRTRCAAAVQCLLKVGCDFSLRNNSGSTPFHLAVQTTGRGGSGSENAKLAQRQIIEDLLAFGASVRLKDGKGKSVVDSAQSEWIKELLRG